MAETLTKSTITRIFRQIVVNPEKDEQNIFWQYVNTKMTSSAKRGIARAVERGPDSARASIANAIKEWKSDMYLRPLNGGRQGQPGQQTQRQQQPQQHQQQQQQRQQQQQQQRGQQDGTRATTMTTNTQPRTVTWKGKGDATVLPEGPKGAARGGLGRGGPKGAAKGRTPWMNLIIDDQTPLLDQNRCVAKKCSITPDDTDEAIDKASGYIMANAATASKLVVGSPAGGTGIGPWSLSTRP
jgi:hypothetical protein